MCRKRIKILSCLPNQFSVAFLFFSRRASRYLAGDFGRQPVAEDLALGPIVGTKRTVWVRETLSSQVDERLVI